MTSLIIEPSAEQTAAADAAMSAEEDARTAEALAKAAAYKEQTGLTSHSNANIAELTVQANRAEQALLAYAQPGEDLTSVGNRIAAAADSTPEQRSALEAVAAAHTSLDAELQRKDAVVAEAQKEAADADHAMMAQSRRADLRTRAQSIAKEEGVTLDTAWQIAMQEIAIDGANERNMPNFTKIRERYVTSFDKN